MSFSWVDVQHLPHKVRNMVRRGYLLKVYNDKKILRGRVKMGDAIENDKLDIIHPIGYIAHVKPTEKTEVLTIDVGGDSSRRVILAVFGDREDHPQPDEGEQFTYAPGNKKIFTRMKMKKQQSGTRADGGNGSNDSGRPEGIHTDADDTPITTKTKKAFSLEAKEGINLKTDLHTFEGDVVIKGELRVAKDIKTDMDGYKPTGPEWKPGSAGVGMSADVLSRTMLADKIKLGPNGEVMIDADLVVSGDLTVTGTIKAKDFVRA